MLLSDFVQSVNSIFPFSAAVSGDNVGLHIASNSGTTERVLICLEITDSVIDEAIHVSADTVLTFHPLIYTPLKTLSGSDRVSKLVLRLVTNGIAVVCVHTAFDVFPQGTNFLLASKLGLETVEVLDPISTNNGSGLGVIARYPHTTDYRTFVHKVAEVCGSVVRHVPCVTNSVTTVAIVAGSGIAWFDKAVASKVDVFVTADVKYHAFHAASNLIGLVDPGHYEMEQFVPAGIIQELRPLLSADCQLILSEINTNPVQYCTAST
ncbi:MAG: Nif3-like dinuclear metal center hexameric protein [Ignavibacteria bacterium]|nr:Nif3-like dinuclear metal center hexameric protein [Ignavibacteria bacterium]